MPTAVWVTIAIFFAGVIFAMGRFSSRVESLEHWRDEVREDLTRIRADLDYLVGLKAKGEH